MIKGKDLRILGTATNKLAAKNYSPYKIIEQLGPVTFRLDMPRQHRVHPVFHASKLLKYFRDEIADRNPNEPGPIEVEGEEEYEIEKILKSRIYRGRVQYLIKWKGYSDAENTWQSLQDLEHSKETWEQFHKDHPSEPKPVSFKNAKPLRT